jgi:hypothetical protein
VNIKLYKLPYKKTSMFWNKKEDKDSLPDLPPLRTPMKPAFDIPKAQSPMQNADSGDDASDEEDSADTSRHGLPSFPDSPLQRGFAQSAIKDAISQVPSESPVEEEPLHPSSIKTMEMDSPPMSSPPAQARQQSFTLDEPPERSYVAPRKPLQKSQEIFVKLDKFNTSYRAITTIAKKVEEMDNALRKIREIKLREEQELAAWEKELSSLKSRLQEISDTLFE